jgi:hypothetical protein
MEDATPRRKLDFIYQEVLGEVSDLVKRLEVVAAAVEEVARTRAGERTAEALELAATAAAGRVRTELTRAADHAGRRVASLLGEAKREAQGAAGAARWHALALSTGLALVAAFVGGGLVVLFHYAGWW